MIRKPKQLIDRIFAYIYFVPLLVVYSAVVVYPIIRAVLESFYDSRILTGTRRFVSLANYLYIFRSDHVFLFALRNNLLYLIGVLALLVPSAILIAFVLQRTKGNKAFITVYLIPYVLPLAGIGILFKMVFNFDFGIATSVVNFLGLSVIKRAWLAEFPDAIVVILFVTVWIYLGGDTLFLFAAMQQIPKEIEESAEIDGASAWIRLTRITVPMVRDMITVVIGSNIIGALTQFALFYIMTSSGPQNQLEVAATWIISQAFDYDRMGYGSALTVILMLIVMAVTFTFLTLRKRADYAQAAA